MADSVLSLTDVQSSLGLLPYVPPATLPSGLLVNPTPTPAGDFDTYAVNIAGVTSNSIVNAQMQVLSLADLNNGTVIYSVQPTTTGGGGIIITTKKRINALSLSWAVLKF
jgi:hypothetical protein